MKNGTGVSGCQDCSSLPHVRRTILATIETPVRFLIFTLPDIEFPPLPNPKGESGIWADLLYTAVVVLHDGTVLKGFGVGATGQATGELCFNTAMTGYQEILTDPSYAGQIITFTFPHIGNVGTNDDDSERVNLPGRLGVRGCVLRTGITTPSNYRATRHLARWLKERGIIGISGVDTRALTKRIREKGYAECYHRARSRRRTSTLRR